MKFTEPFNEFRKLDRGVPWLHAITAPPGQRRKARLMHLNWGDGTLHDYHEFRDALNAERMEAELIAVWERYKPQCDRRAEFSHGGVSGGMVYVPIDAGTEALEIVRRYFSEA